MTLFLLVLKDELWPKTSYLNVNLQPKKCLPIFRITTIFLPSSNPGSSFHAFEWDGSALADIGRIWIHSENCFVCFTTFVKLNALQTHSVESTLVIAFVAMYYFSYLNEDVNLEWGISDRLKTAPIFQHFFPWPPKNLDSSPISGNISMRIHWDLHFPYWASFEKVHPSVQRDIL